MGLFNKVNNQSFADEVNQTYVHEGKIYRAFAVNCKTKEQFNSVTDYYKGLEPIFKIDSYGVDYDASGNTYYGMWIRSGETTRIFTSKRSLERSTLLNKRNVPIISFEEFEQETSVDQASVDDMYNLFGMEITND